MLSFLARRTLGNYHSSKPYNKPKLEDFRVPNCRPLKINGSPRPVSLFSPMFLPPPLRTTPSRLPSRSKSSEEPSQNSPSRMRRSLLPGRRGISRHPPFPSGIGIPLVPVRGITVIRVERSVQFISLSPLRRTQICSGCKPRNPSLRRRNRLVKASDVL